MSICDIMQNRNVSKNLVFALTSVHLEFPVRKALE